MVQVGVRETDRGEPATGYRPLDRFQMRTEPRSGVDQYQIALTDQVRAGALKGEWPGVARPNTLQPREGRIPRGGVYWASS